MADAETSIYGLLAEIQSELKIKKDKWNEFNKFYYRNAETILTDVKPLLKKRGLTLNMSETVELIGTRYYVVSTVQITNGHDFIDAKAYAREEETKKGMDASQITGSASSYARKYALGGLFAIDDGNDADGMDNTKSATKAPVKASSKPAPKAQAPKTDKPITTVYTAQQRDQIHALAGMLGYNDEVIQMKLDTINSNEDAEQMIANLTKLSAGGKDSGKNDAS